MKIVIVGGGTAGWLAASFIELLNTSNRSKDGNLKFDVTLVESPTIPIIGAGEGATGILTDVINRRFGALGMSELEFLYETEATTKMGIRFKDWNGVGTEFLSPLQPTDSVMGNVDLFMLAHKAFGETHNASLCGNLMANGYSTYGISKKETIGLHGYHFDAHKVGEYFKKKCIARKTKHIKSEVLKLNRNSQTGFLESVLLENGTTLDGDFWIDASGFTRAIINEMGAGWVSYENNLPVNAALPYIHNFVDGEDIRLETEARAMPNGWQWQIPTQTRYGCGYVYCDKFITQDKALEELQTITGRKIEPIRNVKFDVGRLDKFWIDNVVGIGLSSGFLEPLEATSIHTTIIQIEMLLNVIDSKENMEYRYNSKFYNDYISRMFDDNKDLLQIHYMTKRDDSPFWKFVKNDLEKTDKTKYILEVCKHRSASWTEFPQYHGAVSLAVWGWTLFGLDIINKETALRTINKYSLESQSKQIIEEQARRNKIQSTMLLKYKDFIQALKNKQLTKK